ncbi:uncharacterized protein [Neodiprion pinetum]|uniref:uncharacterized protein n=1 Tax=Neodiprion pinetum TaxID=441929 RepID=UPI001EDEB6ED|nr:sarcoplasmic reticulum histidine-rich calcium-binding protein-like [Neodiprion pinetum]
MVVYRTMMWCFFAILGCVAAMPSNLESVSVSRTNLADMEASASGYSYQQQHGAPVSYVHFNNHATGNFHNAPTPVVSYIASAPEPAPVAYRAPETILKFRPASHQYAQNAPDNYKLGLPTGYILPLLPKQKEPLAPYFVPVKVDQVPRKIEIADDEKADDDDENDEDHHHDDEDDDDDDEEEYDPSFGHGFIEPAKISGSDYESGSGAEHSAKKHSTHGEKGEKGYKNHQDFDNNEKGEHESENHKGQYSADGGRKKSHSSTSGHYAGHEEGSKGEGGLSYGTEASHKKGHKTSGFHNVYHKDEYKKDTDFYDDAHKSGHFEKQGAFGEHHVSTEGGFKKGGHHDSAYAQNDAAKDGGFDKGHDYKEDQGHSNAKGHQGYRENYADYAAKDAANSGKKHSYAKEHHEPSRYTS